MLGTHVLAALLIGQPAGTGEHLRSTRFGLDVQLPSHWELRKVERDGLIFLASPPKEEAGRFAIVSCEIAPAPESLEDYRTRIDERARREGQGRTLMRNEISRLPQGDRLETVTEIVREGEEVPLVERAVRLVSNRHLYIFTLRADAETFARERREFDALIAAAKFKPPDTGTEPVTGRGNRWRQRELHFAIDLPEGWSPTLAPSEVVLFYASGPAHGIWSDNCLVVARRRGRLSLEEQARELPQQLKAEDPRSELVRCEVVKRGPRDVLETVVRTNRGPFSMSVVEHRFRGERFDYEVKFTVETKRFEELLPAINQCLESFEELSGAVSGSGKDA